MHNNHFILLIVSQLLIVSNVFSQQIEYVEVNGVVVDESYSPIAFTTVVSKKTGRGTISHENGEFHIRVEINDTLVFSALAFNKKSIPVKQLTAENNYISLEKKFFQLGEVNVMDLRWKEFQDKVMNTNLTPLEKTIVEVKGLPNPFQKKILLSPYAGNTNPLSLALTYFKKENVRKRKQKRWRETYRKSYTEKR